MEILNSILLFLLEYQNLPLPVVTRGEESGGERRRPEGAPKGGSKQSLKLKKRRVTRSVLNIYFFSFSLNHHKI